MLVLRNQDGSPYVFPSLLQMKAEIDAMNKNLGSGDIATMLSGLQGVAKANGAAEKSRLKFLESVISLRLIAAQAPVPAPAGPNSLAVAQANLDADNALLGPTNSFMTANQSNPNIGKVGAAAAGVQAFGVVGYKHNSDTVDVSRATFVDSRNRFYVTELQTAQLWITTRLAYMSAVLGVA